MRRGQENGEIKPWFSEVLLTRQLQALVGATVGIVEAGKATPEEARRSVGRFLDVLRLEPQLGKVTLGARR